MNDDVGAIDFVGVPVANQTPAWLIPFPFPFTQWFPNMSPGAVSGVLFGVKDQFSGISYYLDSGASIMVVAPQWASFTDASPEEVVLTIFTPGANRAAQPSAPVQHRLSARAGDGGAKSSGWESDSH